jgi:hypothetical protein
LPVPSCGVFGQKENTRQPHLKARGSCSVFQQPLSLAKVGPLLDRHPRHFNSVQPFLWSFEEPQVDRAWVLKSLKQTCSREYPKAQFAFKDSMIH